MAKEKILVLASGTPTGGGSGAANLVEQGDLYPDLNYTVTCIVSNHADGGVRQKAERLKVPFFHFSSTTWSDEEYQAVLKEHGSGAKYVACSGWLKPVRGLSAAHTFNIHPGDLTVLRGCKPRYGGQGMHGMAVHQRVVEDDCSQSAVCIHFVEDFRVQEYDLGPIAFRKVVPFNRFYNAEQVAAAVNAVELQWQPYVTSLIVNEVIWLEGTQPGHRTVHAPRWYPFLPPPPEHESV